MREDTSSAEVARRAWFLEHLPLDSSHYGRLDFLLGSVISQSFTPFVLLPTSTQGVLEQSLAQRTAETIFRKGYVYVCLPY
jgi:hypothetical protein